MSVPWRKFSIGTVNPAAGPIHDEDVHARRVADIAGATALDAPHKWLLRGLPPLQASCAKTPAG